jgi:hypothetical protein
MATACRPMTKAARYNSTPIKSWTALPILGEWDRVGHPPGIDSLQDQTLLTTAGGATSNHR